MDCDYAIIGSGFGGSVSGLRLVEKGYRVLMLEKGRSFKADDFPRTNWNLRRWLWMPAAGFRGIFKMTFLRHVTVLSGVGVGGGSLVYANTLPIAEGRVLRAPSWGASGRLEAGARAALRHRAADARRRRSIRSTPAGSACSREIAEDIGRPEQFEPPHVAVFFGEPGKTVPDPVLRRRGPRPHRLHPVRRLHDRLPARRQEHARQELPLARARSAG